MSWKIWSSVAEAPWLPTDLCKWYDGNIYEMPGNGRKQTIHIQKCSLLYAQSIEYYTRPEVNFCAFMIL